MPRKPQKSVDVIRAFSVPEKLIAEGKARFPKIVGLNENQLERIRSLTGHAGTNEQAFFHEAVWWWRPLLKIIGKRRRKICVPPASERKFFPAEFFEFLMQAEVFGDLHEVWTYLFRCELNARLQGGDPFGWPSWPAFLCDMKFTHYGDDFMKPTAELPAMAIDLRLSDAEILAEVKKRISKVREEYLDSLPFPLHPKTQKTSYLSESTFARIELIDTRLSIKSRPYTGELFDGEMANVTKAVRAMYTRPESWGV